jgi:hypothetical protein
MFGSVPPTISTGAQTQHPCRQMKRDRDLCAARFLLRNRTVSATMQVKRVNAHHDMNPRLGRGLRCLVRLLHLIGREGS